LLVESAPAHFRFRAASWNVRRGINTTAAKLEMVLQHTTCPHVVMLQETALGDIPQTLSTAVAHHRYQLVHAARQTAPDEARDQQCYGGVLTLVKLDQRYAVSEIRLAAPTAALQEAAQWRYDVDVVGVELTFAPDPQQPQPQQQPRRVQFFNVYAHNEQKHAAGFAKLCAFIRERYPTAIIAGDLNANLVPEPTERRENGVPERRDAVGDELLDHGWTLLTPTHHTMRASASSARAAPERTNDYFIVGPRATEFLTVADNDDTCETITSIPDGSHPSDHNPIRISIVVDSVAEPAARRRIPGTVDWQRVVPELHRAPFNKRFSGELRNATHSRDLNPRRLERALKMACAALPQQRVPRVSKKKTLVELLAAAPRIWTPECEVGYALRDLEKQQLERQSRADTMATALAEQSSNSTSAQAGGGARSSSTERVPAPAQIIDQRPLPRGNARLAHRMTQAIRESVFPVDDLSLASERGTNVTASTVWRNTIEKFARKNASCAPVPPLIDHRDPQKRAVTSDTDRVAVLADLYRNMHRNADSNVSVRARITELLDELLRQPHDNHPVTLWELETAIANMKNGRCADDAGIIAELLSLLDADSRVAMLPFLNSAIAHYVWLEEWSSAITTAIPKRGKPLEQARSWRPISVTRILARLCERIVEGRITRKRELCMRSRTIAHTTLHHDSAFGHSQFAFRKQTSTTHALASLLSFADLGRRQRMHAPVPGRSHTRQHRAVTLVVSIDCDSAFCRADGSIAVKALRDLGSHTEAIFVAQLLLNRTMRVKYGSATSDPVELDAGVPQGTVLGPTVWSLVIEPLLVELERACRRHTPRVRKLPVIYADDICFAVQSYSRRAAVAETNELLAIATRWSERTGIPIGAIKAVWLEGNEHGAATTELDDNNDNDDENNNDNDMLVRCAKLAPIKPERGPTRLLGVYLTSECNFEAHVEHLVKSTRQDMYSLRTLAAAVPRDQARVFYLGRIFSTISYAWEAWYGFASKTARDKLDAIHSEACRHILRAQFGSPTAVVLREAGFRSLQQHALESMIRVHEQLKREPLEHEDDAADFGMRWLRALLVEKRPLQPLELPDGATLETRGHPAGAPPTLYDLDDPLRNQPQLDKAWRAPMCAATANNLALLSKLVPPTAFQTHAPRGLVKKKSTIDELRAANEERLAGLSRSAIHVYTDGSCKAGTACEPGKAVGSFIIYAGGDTRIAFHTEAVPAGPLACSFTAEAAPLHAAMRHICAHKDELRAALAAAGAPADDDEMRVHFVTDSQSIGSAMRRGPINQRDRVPQQLWDETLQLALAGCKPSFHFVFSHVGTAGNELADEVADDALERLGSTQAPLWLTDAVRHRVELSRREYDVRTAREDESFGRIDRPNLRPAQSTFALMLSRADEQLLLRARVGVVPEIGGALFGEAENCPRCGAPAALQRGALAMQHIFAECPCVRELMSTLPPDFVQKRHLQWSLWTYPHQALAYLKTFRNAKNARNDDAAPARAASAEPDDTDDRREPDVADDETPEQRRGRGLDVLPPLASRSSDDDDESVEILLGDASGE
jgi:ribonuclease HI